MTAEGAIEVGGARLWYCTDGEGPDLVLVHAGVADLRMWDGVVAELDGRMRCVRFDMRGFGRTTAPPGPFSSADDLDGLLAQLDIAGAVVAGASFGGLVALELAVAHPRRVARLVLLDPPLSDHPWSEEMEAFDAAESAALEEGRVDDAVELNVRMWAPRATPAQQDLVRDMQARAFRLQLEVDTEPVELDPPVSERLAEIVVPTVVAYGDGDVADFVAIAHRLARELPDATLHAIAGAGHLPALEQPAAVARLIVDAVA
jgi:3-oxoadipate enol-lactonase